MGRPILVAAGLALALGACASAPAAHFTGAVALGPGGRAVGMLTVPAGAVVEVGLENRGPGRAEYVVRGEDGRTRASGALGKASTSAGGTEAARLEISLVAERGAACTIGYEATGAEGFDLTWDLSKASPGDAPPR